MGAFFGVMIEAEISERRKILDFARGSSVYPSGYTVDGNLALKEQSSGEEVYVNNISEGPEKAFLKAEEELYPDKSLARKVAKRYLERDKIMYKQERTFLFWQAIRKLAKLGHINLDGENDTVLRIRESYGERGLEVIKNVQKYVQEKKRRGEKLTSHGIKNCFEKLNKELTPCIGPQRVLQEIENYRILKARAVKAKAEEQRRIYDMVNEALDVGYSGD